MPRGEYSVQWVNGFPVVVAPTEIDVTNAERLSWELRSVSRRYLSTVIVDMSGTVFAGCAALDVLLDLHDELSSRGGELRLVVATPSVHRICHVVGVETVLRIYASVAEAVARAPGAAGVSGAAGQHSLPAVPPDVSEPVRAPGVG